MRLAGSEPGGDPSTREIEIAVNGSLVDIEHRSDTGSGHFGNDMQHERFGFARTEFGEFRKCRGDFGEFGIAFQTIGDGSAFPRIACVIGSESIDHDPAHDVERGGANGIGGIGRFRKFEDSADGILHERTGRHGSASGGDGGHATQFGIDLGDKFADGALGDGSVVLHVRFGDRRSR